MHAGSLIHQFCPRDKHKQFLLPWNMRTIVIKIQAMTRQAPLYTLRWKSNTNRQKVQSLTPAPNVISSSDRTIIISTSSQIAARILILTLLHFTIIFFMWNTNFLFPFLRNFLFYRNIEMSTKDVMLIYWDIRFSYMYARSILLARSIFRNSYGSEEEHYWKCRAENVQSWWKWKWKCSRIERRKKSLKRIL